jgi:GMP synthase-like glutamine amidotransferase
MGGPMSVNDDLPWIPPSLELIRAADAAGIPVIGHCLGGQLMAKAFGGTVGRNPVKEIGWGEVAATGAPEAADWLGDAAASRPSTGTARLSASHPERPASLAARTAPTRPSCAARTWGCNAMSR